MRQPARQTRPPRAGFSLIELLVVVTIMAIVVGTLITFLGVGGAAARRGATQTTIEKLDSMLKARLDEFNKNLAEQERKKARADLLAAGNLEANWLNIQSNAEALGGAYASLPLASKIAIIKLDRYRGTFPQRYADMHGLNGTADPAAGYVDDSPLWRKYFLGSPPPSVWNGVPRNPSAHQPETESSELLYLILLEGKGTGASKGIADDINPRHLKDSDGDGIPEIYDDWGNMLRFYNAPTRLLRPGGVDTTPTTDQFSLAETLISGLPRRPTQQEIDDLSNPLLRGPYNQNSFNQNPFDTRKSLHMVFGPPGSRTAAAVTTFENLFHTPDTFFKPLIVSAGEDGDFGLGAPTATGPERLAAPASTDLSTAADNITNLQRLGGN